MATDKTEALQQTSTGTPTDSLTILRSGALTLHGIFRAGSNYTFLADVTLGKCHIEAVYKPTEGEQPLWDFPHGSLAKREEAAYLVSHALGWGLVPPTVYRDGPHGPGSLQQFVEFDDADHYFNFTTEEKAACKRVAVFDYLINNADRKGSHVVRGIDGKMWLIDHGLSFHSKNKLRTVIWEYAGKKMPAELGSDLKKFVDNSQAAKNLAYDLSYLLTKDEIAAFFARVQHMVITARLPQPGQERSYPWPPL